MDTTTASGELLFHVFGALAQYEQALTRERVIAGLAAAKRRGRNGGRPPAIVGEKLDAILAALRGGMSKAAVCRNFGVKRTTSRNLISLITPAWPISKVSTTYADSRPAKPIYICCATLGSVTGNSRTTSWKPLGITPDHLRTTPRRSLSNRPLKFTTNASKLRRDWAS